MGSADRTCDSSSRLIPARRTSIRDRNLESGFSGRGVRLLLGWDERSRANIGLQPATAGARSEPPRLKPHVGQSLARTHENVSVSLSIPLRTARLTLRDFAPSDFDAIHAYASDPEVTRYMFYGPRTVADTHAYLERMLASQREEPRLIWELGVCRDGR